MSQEKLPQEQGINLSGATSAPRLHHIPTLWIFHGAEPQGDGHLM